VEKIVKNSEPIGCINKERKKSSQNYAIFLPRELFSTAKKCLRQVALF